MQKTIYILLIIVMAGVVGCSRPQQADKPTPIERKAKKGPVEMTVVVGCSEAQVAQPVILTAEVTADSGVTVKFAPLDKTFGDMQVVSCDDAPDIPLDDGKKRFWKRTAILEAYTPGEKDIPAVKVDFEDSRNPKKTIKSFVETEPMKLKVSSVIKGKTDPYKPRDIKGAVELTPKPDYTWVWYAGGGIVALIVALLLIRYFVRRKIMRALTAGEWAMRQLNQLEGEHLPEAGKVERFYVRLTGIVRNYIERRFAIAAPKLTTREFLEEVQERHAFDDNKRAGLQDFLTAADMVKFAQFTPHSVDVANSMQTARQFVEQTAARSEKEVRG